MLKISRDDVSSTELTEFPVATRFIKLPIKRYLEMLGAYESINPPQIALINAINNPKYRFVCAAFARRLGKTYIANVIAQLISLVPNYNVLVISPNYNLSSISFELQRKFIKHFELEVERDNLKDRIIELSNGSTIRMGSLSTVDSTVGRSYQLILFDEAALGSNGEEAFNIQLRPTLDRQGAKAIFISTPRGMLNWFSRFWQRGFNPEFPEWCSLQADYTENKRMSEEDVAEARRSMSRAEFEQEYLASFTTFAGQIFNFNHEINCIEYAPKDDAEFIAGCDPGYTDPTAFVVIVYSATDDCFHIVDEYLNNEKTTAKHAAAFRELIDKWDVDITFIDHAAAQFAADLAYMYDISTTKAKKDKLPGIGYVQSLVEQNRLKIAPHCENCLATMDQYRWDTKETLTKEKPVHDRYSHMADAIRYATYSYML